MPLNGLKAWAISVPWYGFPLSQLLEKLGVQKGKAKYILFTSFLDSEVTPNQKTLSYYPWPYTEAITVEEAMSEMAFLTVGAYQDPIGTSSGAPIRLTLPWK
jgi:sulfoxide reductase catalytic subunit YedY